MKRLLLLFVFAFAASAIQAQNEGMYSLLYFDTLGYYNYPTGVIQQRDGDFILSSLFYEDLGNHTTIPLGNMFYKISSITHTITDSLFIAEPSQTFIIARDVRGEGNIRVNFEYHEDCDTTFLRICHFHDNNLLINAEEDVVVSICEGIVFLDAYSLVDCWGDLIIWYFKELPDGDYEDHLARISLDGTLKYQALVSLGDYDYLSPQIQVLKKSPLKYYQWGRSEHTSGNLAVFVTDSLFQTNTVVLNKILSEEAIPNYPNYIIKREYLYLDVDAEMIPGGGDDILVAAQYRKDTTYHSTIEYGVAVAKYDIRTMQLKGYIAFNDYLGYYNQAYCIGLKRMPDGTVYFIYKEHPYPDESVIVVKMDTDLNVEWKRVCKTEDIIISYPFYRLSLLYENDQEEEQGIVWVGLGKKIGNDRDGIVCFFLNHDGTVGMNETGIVVRPYAFYPNPVKEQLLMDFSPDVQPIQMELYDLQGRMVRTQSKAFESIDLSQLPAGTYTMRVTLEDGKSYTDKVVKE